MSDPAPPSSAPWRLFGFAGLLLLLGTVAHQFTWHTVERADLVGTYERQMPLFLPVDSTPSTVVLYEDGRMELSGIAEAPSVQTHWAWDPDNRVIRTDDPRWDLQIRLRSRWTGPRLSVRVCPISFSDDLSDRDDEVDLIKIGPPTSTTRPHALGS